MSGQRRRSVLRAQSAYYLATGLAPFVSRRAFEAVTGPKTEWWLVQTVGAIVAVVGGALASAAERDRVTPELTAIAIGTAASLGGIEAFYVARGRISPVYLLDAAIEATLIAGLTTRPPTAD
jgi:hypothetical protein